MYMEFSDLVANYVLWIIRTVLILIRMSAIDILFLVTEQAHYVLFWAINKLCRLKIGNFWTHPFFYYVGST